MQVGRRRLAAVSGLCQPTVGVVTHVGDVVSTGTNLTQFNFADASLDVLASLDHEVSRRGAYLAYIGSRELPVKVRVLDATGNWSGYSRDTDADGTVVRSRLDGDLLRDMALTTVSSSG